MKKILFIFLIMLHVSCANNTLSDKTDAKHVVSDKVIYEFLEFVLENNSKTIIVTRNTVDEDFIKDISKMNTVFSKADINFIMEQAKNEKYFKINADYLGLKNIISEKTISNLTHKSKSPDEFWGKINSKYKTGSIFTLSMPLFSKDKKTVITKTGVQDESLFYAQGTCIYTKKNGSWFLIDKINSSIN